VLPHAPATSMRTSAPKPTRRLLLAFTLPPIFRPICPD
jgi:hypothetical protein